jgi:hypothetical protein
MPVVRVGYTRASLCPACDVPAQYLSLAMVVPRPPPLICSILFVVAVSFRSDGLGGAPVGYHAQARGVVETTLLSHLEKEMRRSPPWSSALVRCGSPGCIRAGPGAGDRSLTE